MVNNLTVTAVLWKKPDFITFKTKGKTGLWKPKISQFGTVGPKSWREFLQSLAKDIRFYLVDDVSHRWGLGGEFTCSLGCKFLIGLLMYALNYIKVYKEFLFLTTWPGLKLSTISLLNWDSSALTP